MSVFICVCVCCVCCLVFKFYWRKLPGWYSHILYTVLFDSSTVQQACYQVTHPSSSLPKLWIIKTRMFLVYKPVLCDRSCLTSSSFIFSVLDWWICPHCFIGKTICFLLLKPTLYFIGSYWGLCKGGSLRPPRALHVSHHIILGQPGCIAPCPLSSFSTCTLSHYLPTVSLPAHSCLGPSL